jgi:uncharacterized protein (TIGR02246 family)
VIVFYSCNEQDKIQIEKSASAFDIKQGEASVLQSNQHFMKSFKSSDTVEVAQSFTTDAKIMVAGQMPVSGRTNLVHFFSNMIKKNIAEYKLTTLQIRGDSSVLVEEGTYIMLDSSGSQKDKGEYISLWEQESGNWKIYRDMWVSSNPLSAIKIDKDNLPSQ